MSFTSVESDHASCDLQGIPQIRTVLEYIYGGFDNVHLPATMTSGSALLQGCLPLLMEEQSAEALIECTGAKKYEQLRSLYQQSSLLNLWYDLELKHILEAMTDAQIPVMILKGADIATTLYPRPELRQFGDIDLMVRPADLAATVAILERLGYHYHQEYRFESISKQRAAFVYAKEVAVGYLVFEIHTSPHNNEMAVTFDAAQLWERARPITVAGIDVRGMGLEDLLLYLCWHYRSHSFDRLIWLYDIAILLVRCADRLDWQLVHSLAGRQGLTSTVYYCARWCQQLFDLPISEYAEIERFKPPALIQKLITHFVGDDLTSVLRRDGHRERKILQRLMVDNVRALYVVLSHIIIPSPTHLGRLYMEQYRLPVRLFWLYYPLHPLFILTAYFKNSHHKRSSPR